MNRDHTFVLGDRVFARLIVHRRNIVELAVDSVSNMSELLAIVREKARDKWRGLAKLYVRNISRGWSIERPLTIYPDTYKDENGTRHLTQFEMMLNLSTYP